MALSLFESTSEICGGGGLGGGGLGGGGRAGGVGEGGAATSSGRRRGLDAGRAGSWRPRARVLA